MDDRGRIVELGRIGHREDRTGARLEPERLVVGRPIHHVAVAGLLQQVGRGVAFRRRRSHPSLRRSALAARDLLGHVVDQAALVELPQVALALRVGAAMAHHLVAALADALADLRVIFVEQRVDVVRGGQLQLVEQVEHPPDADPVAIVAPGVIALLLRLALLGRIPAGALAIGVDLDVGRRAKGEPLALRPGIVLALADDRIVIAVVLGKRQHRFSPSVTRDIAGRRAIAPILIHRCSRKGDHPVGARRIVGSAAVRPPSWSSGWPAYLPAAASISGLDYAAYITYGLASAATSRSTRAHALPNAH